MKANLAKISHGFAVKGDEVHLHHADLYKSSNLNYEEEIELKVESVRITHYISQKIKHSKSLYYIKNTLKGS